MAQTLPSTVVLAAADDASRPRRPDQGFQAHILGQTGARRGLRGGQPVLDAARAAYLSAEWRGPDDRRLPVGALKAVRL